MALIGATLTAVEPGYCAIELVPRPAVSQQHGYVHAGVVARSSTPPAGTRLHAVPGRCSVLTVEFKLNLVAPAQASGWSPKASSSSAAARSTITRGEVHARARRRRTLVALMQQTLMTMHGRPDAD